MPLDVIEVWGYLGWLWGQLGTTISSYNNMACLVLKLTPLNYTNRSMLQRSEYYHDNLVQQLCSIYNRILIFYWTCDMSIVYINLLTKQLCKLLHISSDCMEHIFVFRQIVQSNTIYNSCNCSMSNAIYNSCNCSMSNAIRIVLRTSGQWMECIRNNNIM